MAKALSSGCRGYFNVKKSTEFAGAGTRGTQKFLVAPSATSTRPREGRLPAGFQLAIGYWLSAISKRSLRRVCVLLFPVDGVVEDFEVFLDDVG